MNLNMSWGELARSAGGRLVRGGAEDQVASISTDTRRLAAGQAFWALKGPRFDAHDLLDEALAGKASGWVVETGRAGEHGAKARHLVEVTNTLKALQALAAGHRRRFDIPVVAITGSNGKTTTKEMLKLICRRVGPTCASPGNWNNQLGVPLSVLELTPEHRYGIFELADCHPGDIRDVALVASPTLAVLTNIGPDHLEFYGTLEENFKTKSEILEGLPEEGKVVINLDDPWLSGLEPRLGPRAVTFGANPRAKVRFSGKDEMIIDRHKTQVALKTFGDLSRYNAAAAAAAAWGLGIAAETIRQGLEDYRPSAMRLEIIRHPSGCEIVLDAYNANPASMRAAIEGFCEEYSGKPLVLVLGDMKELGPASEKFHRELGQWLASLALKSLFLGGEAMRATAQAVRLGRPPFPVHYASTPEGLLDQLRGEFIPGNVLFFKASRAMKFESLLGYSPCSTT